MTVIELGKLHKWNMPMTCPICGGSLEINDNHTEVTCTNEVCKSKLIGRLKKWADKLEIKELAPVTLEKFIDKGLVSSISDLYKADFSVIKGWEGFGERSAEIYKKNISKANHAKLAQFIAGYNIDSLGERMIQRIVDAKGYKTVDDFLNVKSYKDYVCDGIADITADKLYNGLKKVYPDMVETMKYVTVEAPVSNALGNKFEGVVFCFTGKACKPRKELQAMAESLGGKCADSVTKNTTYLVTDDELSGSSKAKKAQQLGTKILRSQEFVDMCSEA